MEVKCAETSISEFEFTIFPCLRASAALRYDGIDISKLPKPFFLCVESIPAVAPCIL